MTARTNCVVRSVVRAISPQSPVGSQYWSSMLAAAAAARREGVGGIGQGGVVSGEVERFVGEALGSWIWLVSWIVRP